jgi:hypothetical protein
MAPPPPQPPSTPVRVRGQNLGMAIRFTIPRLPPGEYQLAIGCPEYHGEQGDIPEGLYPVSPDTLTITSVPDTATAGGLSTLHAVAWVSAAAVGCLALVVRFRRA